LDDFLHITKMYLTVSGNFTGVLHQEDQGIVLSVKLPADKDIEYIEDSYMVQE
jgi:hypothetical protein